MPAGVKNFQLTTKQYVRGKIFKMCGYMLLVMSSMDIMLVGKLLLDSKSSLNYFDYNLYHSSIVFTILASSFTLVSHFIFNEVKVDMLAAEKVKAQLHVVTVIERVKYVDIISIVFVVIALSLSIMGAFVSRDSMIERYGYMRVDYLYDEEFHMILDDVHQQFQCCGATGHYEWIVDKLQLPPSCCNSTKPQCLFADGTAEVENIFTKTCVDTILHERKISQTFVDNVNFWHLILLLIHWHVSRKYFYSIKMEYEEDHIPIK